MNLKKTSVIFYFSIFLISIALVLPMVSSAEVQRDDQIEMYYFYNPGCDICSQVGPSVYGFAADNSEMNFIPVFVDFSNTSSSDQFYQFFNDLGYSVTGIPIVAFIKGDCSAVVRGSEINSARLNSIYIKMAEADGECPELLDDDFDLDAASSFLLYGLGFISGLSPCILLILGFVSASYLGSDENESDENTENVLIVKKKPSDYLKFILGFVIGTVLIYTLVSLAIIFSLDFLSTLIFGNIIQYLFAGLLIFIGLWYIIDAKNEGSKLFKTPEVVKKMFRNIINTKSFGSSLLLGIVFTMIKLPCIGAILLALLLNMTSNPAFYFPRLVVYFTGVLTPLIIVAFLLIYGLNTNKLNSLRVKYRPVLRAVSGIVIILIVIYSLFL